MQHLNHIGKALITISAIVILTGCADKQVPQPKPIVITEYKDRYITVPCQVKVPTKPIYNSEKITTASDLLQYYETVEALLFKCIDPSLSKGN